MPIVKAGPYDIDYAEAGTGPAVLLLHSSAAGNRQWRALMDERAGKNRMFAVNLFGYGATTPWPADRPLTLDDEANLVAAVAHFVPDPVVLIGHSLGGAVAAAVAHRLGDRVSKLIVFEPILFYLLKLHGEFDAFDEIESVLQRFIAHGSRGEWDAAGRLFIDYWTGLGAWDAMNDERRLRILPILPPLVHEWGMVGTSAPPLEHWARIKAPVHYLHAGDTRLSSRRLAALMQREIPQWRFHQVPEGGHTAPITRPDLVNPVIAEILDRPA
jgi:pimeloyl-ACP methyl ester carboxylesterase